MECHPPPHQLTPEYLHALFDQLPVPLSVYDAHGNAVGYNQAQARLFQLPPDFLTQGFNLLTDPNLVRIGIADLMQRVFAGETVVVPPHFFEKQDATTHVALWTEATYRPLRTVGDAITHMVVILRDVTEEYRQQEQIRVVQQEIADARADLSAQQQALDQLSTPVIQVWDSLLVLPLIGTVDSRRAMQITDSLLSAIADRQAEWVLIDITGLPLVDTQVAAYLLQAMKACMLLGCEVCLVGMRSEVAQTLVQLGVDFQHITTLANLQAGIAWAFARRGLTVA